MFSFGQPQAAKPPAATPSLFGTPAASTTTPAAGTTTGLFGQPAAQPAAAAPSTGGGLFGQSAAPAAGASSTGGLFGQPAATPAPPAGGGLFGQPAAAASTSQPASGGLFGSTQPAAPASGGLFGQQQPAQSSSLSLFGKPATPAPSTSLFGQSQPQQQQTSSLFGQPQQPQQQQQQQQQQPGQQQQGPAQIERTTKFVDLPEGVQKVIEGIDSYIQSQVALSHALAVHPLSSEHLASSSYADRPLSLATSISRGADPEAPSIPQTARLFDRLSAELNTLNAHLATCASDLKALDARLKEDADDAVRSARIIDAAKTPQGRQQLRGQARFPTEFFAKTAGGLERRVKLYSNTLSELSLALSTLPHPSTSSTPTPQHISLTLQSHQSVLQRLAADVASLHESVLGLKDEFRALYRARVGGAAGARDVFRKEEREVGGLRI